MTEAVAVFSKISGWFPPRTPVLISSNEPPSFFASTAATQRRAVLFATNFSSQLRAAAVRNNNVLYALEILLQVGAASHVETFQTDSAKARIVCAIFGLLERKARGECEGRRAGRQLERGVGGPLHVRLECTADGRARVLEVNGVAEGACPGATVTSTARWQPPCRNRGLWLVGADNSTCRGRWSRTPSHT